MIARVIFLTNSCRMLGIADRLIKIDNRIERVRAADPFVHCLTDRFTALVIHIRTFEGSQSRPKNLNCVRASSANDLLQAYDHLVRRYGLRCEWPLFGFCTFRSGHSDTRETNIVDSQQNDHVGRARKRQHIPIEAGERAWSGYLVQDAISTNSLIHNCNGCSTMLCQPFCQLIRIIDVLTGFAPGAFRYGIAESNCRAGAVRGPYIDAGDKIYRLFGFRIREIRKRAFMPTFL